MKKIALLFPWLYISSLLANPSSPTVTHGNATFEFNGSKLIIKNEEIKKVIIENNLNCLSYCDENGSETAEYPQNPNGSDLNCAAITNESGQVFGMMPHPEAFLSLYNHPNWGQLKRQNPQISEDGEGLKIFKNIVDKIKN